MQKLPIEKENEKYIHEKQIPVSQVFHGRLKPIQIDRYLKL